jgi:hypothetical protein
MGRQWEDFKISASLSRHNSEQDIIDNSLWEELQERIKLIVMEHRYEPINPMTD